MTDKTDYAPMTIGLSIGQLNPESKPIINGLLSPNPGVKIPDEGLLSTDNGRHQSSEEKKDG